MDDKKLINKLDEYIVFLNNVNEGPISLAWIHGWKCPKEDIEKGKQLRKEIEELRKKRG